MAEPVVYVSSWKIKDGQFNRYQRFHERLARIVEEHEPDVAAFLSFANDDGTEITGVHVFRDSAALDHHMKVLAEKLGLLPDDISDATTMLEPGQIELFGKPGASAAQMDKSLAEQGVPFAVKRHFVGGFVRASR